MLNTSNIYEDEFVLSNVDLLKLVLFQSGFVDVGCVWFAISFIFEFYVIPVLLFFYPDDDLIMYLIYILIQVNCPEQLFHDWPMFPNKMLTAALIESEWLLFNSNSAIVSAISWWEQVNFQWNDDEIRFVLDQHTQLDFYSASPPKQQSADRRRPSRTHYAGSEPISLCSFSGEATNTNFRVFGLTRSGLELTIFHT